MAKNNKQNNSGFADTKDYPHRNHPAHYRRKGRDSIEYITFTHTKDKVKLKNKEYNVIPLTDNISKKERLNNRNKSKEEQSKSYVFPKKFIGKRSALKSERNDLSFVENDKKIVDNLFKTLPTEYVNYSRKKNNKNKKK